MQRIESMGSKPRSPTHSYTNEAPPNCTSLSRYLALQGEEPHYKKSGADVVVLLCGGDKSTQDADIAKAKKLVRELEDGTV